MKICPSCGKEFHDMDNFCMLCGDKLKQKEDVFHKKIEKLEKKISAMPAAAPAKHSDVQALRNRWTRLNRRWETSHLHSRRP